MRTGLYQHQVGEIGISWATLTIYPVRHPQKQPTIIPSDDKNEDTESGVDKAAEKENGSGACLTCLTQLKLNTII